MATSRNDWSHGTLHQTEFVLYAQNIMPPAPQTGERAFQEIFVRFKEEDANG